MSTASRTHAWNRRGHYYVGLYLLVFLWFFSISGLILNHSSWNVAQFWKARRESVVERAFVVPTTSSDVGIASDLMRQLGIEGEIGEIKRSPDGSVVEMQVVKPGHVYRIAARLDSAHASITTIALNGWGALDALHKFTGVRMDEPTQTRDWILTRIWSLAMDALALGLIALVLSGVYLWLRLRGKRAIGTVSLVLGVASCAWFLLGLGARI